MAKKRIKSNIETTIITSEDLKPAWDTRSKVSKDTFLIISHRASKIKSPIIHTSSKDGYFTDKVKEAKVKEISLAPLLVASFIFICGIAGAVIGGILDHLLIKRIFIIVLIIGLGVSVYAFNQMRKGKPFIRDVKKIIINIGH